MRAFGGVRGFWDSGLCGFRAHGTADNWIESSGLRMRANALSLN